MPQTGTGISIAFAHMDMARGRTFNQFELTHFFERNHSERFVSLMDAAMPNWRTVRDELNVQPLANEEW